MSLPLTNPSVAFRVDDSTYVRFISQYTEPFPLPDTDPDDSPEHLSELYLTDAATDFGLTTGMLTDLNSEPSPDLNRDYLELRLASVEDMNGFTIMFYAQTYFGIPIWKTGLTINIQDDPFQVVRGLSTCIFTTQGLTAPDIEVLENYSEITASELATLIGANEDVDGEITIVDASSLFIYEYKPSRRFNQVLDEDGIGWYNKTETPGVDSGISDGDACIVRQVVFTFPTSAFVMNWFCLIELNTGSILHIDAGLARAQAYVFEHDPITLGYGPLNSPPGIKIDTATQSQLNGVRTTVTLNNLDSPDPTLGQMLRGTYVKILDAITDVGNVGLQAQPIGTPTSRPYTGEPPHQGSPYQFYYDADSDAFSAVCAYYHIDKFFTKLVTLGFTIGGSSSDFPNTPIPLPVDHWGNDLQGSPWFQSGIGAGVYPKGVTTPGCHAIILSRLTLTNTQGLTFLGVGTSDKMLLHELAHVLMSDRITSTNFAFAHSFGDSLAAIVVDPYNQCPAVAPSADYDKHTTMPWDGSGTASGSQGTLERRHDRRVSGGTSGITGGGWYWGGAHDPMGGNDQYKGEQILSTTMFLAYRALGGDSFVTPTLKNFASDLMVLLMVKTVKNYSSTSATTPNAPQMAMDYSEDIIANDKFLSSPSTITYNNTAISLGLSHKVIRWAFERQGAYYFVPWNQYPSPHDQYNPPAFDPPAVDNLYL